MTQSERTTIDQAEVDRFSAMAAEWWSPTGKFKPLHKFNPVRLTYIGEEVCKTFDRDMKAAEPFKGLRILDIGCGGGLLSEPMARLGATVIGADPSQVNIEVAKIHAAQSDLSIDYRAETAEALAAAGEQFDVILNMEVVEHVADVPLFIEACGKMLNTHQYEKLVKPEELESAMNASGLTLLETTGVFYNPLLGSWNKSRDTDVNYMMLATKVTE
jgi:2-polyprenyl-6-hydroxyphenyl methylase / 3-demethylubiquinone-9 3-methyltransferase